MNKKTKNNQETLTQELISDEKKDIHDLVFLVCYQVCCNRQSVLWFEKCIEGVFFK